MQETGEAVSFEKVLQAELDDISALRSARGATDKVPSDGDALKRAHGASLVGLAFSGGGIRSATFNLGVLQGLAKLRLLGLFDYLSTVSGGGYIGSWFTVWLKRRGWNTVLEALAPRPSESPNFSTPEPSEVSFLRDYSNYITPRKGLFSGDTWVVFTTYARNLMLNLSILVLALAAVLILLRAVAAGVTDLVAQGADFWGRAQWVVLALMAYAIASVRWYLSSLFDDPRHKSSQQRSGAPWKVCVTILLPVLVSAWIFAAALGAIAQHWSAGHAPGPDAWMHWALITGMAYVAIWLFAWAVGFVQDIGKYAFGVAGASNVLGRVFSATRNVMGQVSADMRQMLRMREKGLRFAGVMGSAFVAGALAGPLLFVLTGYMQQWLAHDGGALHIAAFGMPIVVIIFASCAVVHIGLAGRGFHDEAREWWSRLGAYLLLANSAYLALFVLAFYSPLAVARSEQWVNTLMTSGWLATSVAGLISGRSASSGKSGVVRNILMALAPPVFVVGLLVLLAWGVYEVMPHLPWTQPAAACSAADYWCLAFAGVGYEALALGAAAGVAALVLSWRIGINDFSIHAFYGSRLVRAYLGASNRARRAHPFTGFDPMDNDTLVSQLTHGPSGYVGPYPIFNTAVNLTRDGRLAWQQRKARSFVFTPRFSGFDIGAAEHDGRHAYRPTLEYGGGVTVGKAMAISGAAASPNMGYHSSPALAFLMTVFNVRLGWWIGNPAHPSKWRRRGPRVGLFYLLNELFGMTSDKRAYVYLSDGGHFENLGVYELVRRRCRYIVACDAGEDRNFGFGDLGNAVERIRADFGIEVELDVGRIRRSADGLSTWHCALGRIRYSRVDEGAEDGWLLYVKSSVTGKEPVDVAAYRTLCKEFPHQSTSDQWFDESQFESYRALGEHVITTVLGGAGDGRSAKAVFDSAAKQWCCEVNQK